ncbi:restriction endonuclease [Sporolactobacillus shoreicorticis]|uniref:Restriction endonuclease n=1 Tax=Sporolactobacillus shoreicorticis TaxID=1923877 RepID=A0ABW5RYP6_9BACL|nr:restriction endonuclease [Sporolactobacillus shoreicorticis]MCO7124771.1 restriction endonuclease [Sporolactobacillus shoreicorticis]
MNQKQRRSIIEAVKIVLLLAFLAYTLLNRLSLQYLIASLIIPQLVAMILSMILPKATSKKQNLQKKKSTANKISISKSRQLPDKEILKLPLHKISARELERLCYLYYKSKGYKNFETRKGSDGGIDIVYEHPRNGKTAVQIKHYLGSQKQIPVMQIRELNSSKRNYHCVYSEFITTSRFSLPARQERPVSMTFRDITWFEKEIIPWMKKS